jgi:ABC-type Fe3+ transport system substrate-binding protein
MTKIHGVGEKINIFYFLSLLTMLFLCYQSTNLYADTEKKVMKEKIVIISPYPAKFIDGFRRAFEYHHPEYAIQVHKMKTKEGVDYLKQKKGENTVDLFWATSIDAYEILKADDLLASYKSAIQGIPPQIAGIPVADPDHLYSGFAFTGVGLMWNIPYLKSNRVDAPKNWIDLADVKYAGLIGMSSPARSGTTHVAVESILQTHGWDKGWQLLQQIGSNVRKVTAKSSHVPKGVKNGQFGIGIVVDYYGLSAQAKHFPVNFTYTQPAIMFPASIALIKDAPHASAAKLFIDFLLSLEGQHLLLNKEVARLPIRMESYEAAPDNYPNPFKKTEKDEAFKLDFSLSKSRYALVNALFDSLITLNLESLKAVHKSIQQLEKKIAKQSNAKASDLLQQAQQALYVSLASEKQALNTVYNAKLNESKDVLKQQLEVWSSEMKEHYKTAQALADKGLAL